MAFTVLEESPFFDVREVKLMESVCAVAWNVEQAKYIHNKTADLHLDIRNAVILPVCNVELGCYLQDSI